MRTDELSYHYFGLYLGTVLSVDDPENLGRLRIDTDQYADGDGTEAVWAPVARPAAGSKTGIFFTPKQGDQVIVGYLAGDVERPVVLGYAHSSSEPPPVQSAKDKQAIVTGIGSVVFDETKKSITVTLDGPPPSSVTLDETGIALRSGKTITLSAPALVFAGYPTFGPPEDASVPAPSDPVKMDFANVGLAISTGSKELCVNGHAIAQRKFVTEIYNGHTHAGGAPPLPVWTPATDLDHRQISNCEDPP